MKFNNEPSVVIVTSIELLPVDCGKKVVLNGLAKYLCARLGVEAVNWIVVGDLDASATSNWNGMQIRRVAGQSGKKKLMRLFESVCFGRFSFQEAVFRSSKTKFDVMSAIEEIKPDLVIVDTIRLASLVEFNKLTTWKRVIYLEDLFSVRYRLLLQQMSNGVYDASSVLGNFANKIPKIAKSLIENSTLIRRWILTKESVAVARSEIEVSNKYPLALLLNPTEVELLRGKGVSGVREMPPYMELSAVYLRRPRLEDFFVFLGDLTLPHNESGLLDFIKNHLPGILSAEKRFKLRIVGKGASSRLLAAAAPFGANIQIIGYVEDIENLLATCRGMLAPLTFGSGVKLKALDALSRGVPLLSTDFGVEGVPVLDKVHYINTKSTQDYIAAIRNLYDDAVNLAISTRAYEFFLKNYSKDVVFKKYDELFFAS